MHAAGNSRFTVDGLSIAQARAEAYAEAYVSATASASVCSPNFNCTAVASFVGSAFQAIFAEAVARAEVTLDQDSPDTSVTAFSQNVTNVTASVWAVVRPLDLLGAYALRICSAGVQHIYISPGHQVSVGVGCVQGQARSGCDCESAGQLCPHRATLALPLIESRSLCVRDCTPKLRLDTYVPRGT